MNAYEDPSQHTFIAFISVTLVTELLFCWLDLLIGRNLRRDSRTTATANYVQFWFSVVAHSDHLLLILTSVNLIAVRYLAGKFGFNDQILMILAMIATGFSNLRWAFHPNGTESYQCGIRFHTFPKWR